MKTRRKYYDNTYLYEGTAKVTMVGKEDKGGEFIRLDETIFHPQGGGQPSDVGTMNGVIVAKVTLGHDDREEINHYIPNASAQFKVGDEVKLVVNQEKRLEFAAIHTGGHVLANVLRKLGILTSTSITSVKSHHFPNEAYFQVKPDEGFVVPQIEDLKKLICEGVQDMLNKKYPITVRMDGATRKMRVGDFNEDPCGGTHLSNTGEMKDFSIRKITVNNKEGVKVGYNMGFFANTQREEQHEAVSVSNSI